MSSISWPALGRGSRPLRAHSEEHRRVLSLAVSLAEQTQGSAHTPSEPTMASCQMGGWRYPQ